MNDIIAMMFGILLGYFFKVRSTREPTRNPYELLQQQNKFLKDWWGKKIEAKKVNKVEFLGEPDKKILGDIKDKELGLSDFYETIEKPSNDED